MKKLLSLLLVFSLQADVWFDGIDDVATSNGTIFTGINPTQFEVWFYMIAPPPASGGPAVLFQQGAGSSGVGLILSDGADTSPVGGNILCIRAAGVDSNTTDSAFACGSNQWYHAVAWFANPTWRLIVNGVSQSNKNATGGTSPSGNAHFGDLFNGYIGEIKARASSSYTTEFATQQYNSFQKFRHGGLSSTSYYWPMHFNADGAKGGTILGITTTTVRDFTLSTGANTTGCTNLASQKLTYP